MEETAAGPTATLADQEILANSPQGQVQGKEKHNFLTLQFSSQVLQLCPAYSAALKMAWEGTA